MKYLKVTMSLLQSLLHPPLQPPRQLPLQPQCKQNHLECSQKSILGRKKDLSKFYTHLDMLKINLDKGNELDIIHGHFPSEMYDPGLHVSQTEEGLQLWQLDKLEQSNTVINSDYERKLYPSTQIHKVSVH